MERLKDTFGWLVALVLWPVAAVFIYGFIITYPLHGISGNPPNEDERQRWRDHGW